MIRVHAFTRQLGLGVGAGGNPEIVAIDDSGITVTIEVESGKVWDAFVQNAGRLRGVGIIPAHLRDIADAAEASMKANGG